MHTPPTPVTVSLPDGSAPTALLTLHATYLPWADTLRHHGTLTVAGLTLTLDATFRTLSGPRKDLARTLHLVTPGTSLTLHVPVLIHDLDTALAAHVPHALAWLHHAQHHDRQHHRPAVLHHPGGGHALVHARTLSSAERHTTPHPHFPPPGIALAPHLPRRPLATLEGLHLHPHQPHHTTDRGEHVQYLHTPHPLLTLP